MVTAREFKSAGFDIHLLFMGLTSLEQSILRVADRVSRGGHKVSEESIRFNYEFGYKNLYKYVTEFDSVTLFDNDISSHKRLLIPQEILHIENGQVIIRISDYPEWVKPVVEQFRDYIFLHD
jgi:predicted ABC-type ATPase